MKRIAVFIALGSIIAGIFVWFWPPAPCEGVASVLPCSFRLSEALNGSFILILGIALLPLIAMTNSRHDTLALLGVLLNFGSAIIAAGLSLGMNNVSTDPKPVDLFMSTVMGGQAIGFFCAGLSANFIKETFFSRETESSS